jgi:molecular chaperone DnaK
VFVGGTTRVPHFQDVCKRVLGKDIRIYNSLDPDQTISIGASIQGALMSGKMSDDVNADALVLDVIPLSLGIETIGGIMTPIISKNTPIPVTRSRIFSNSEDHVDSVSIDIYQGERKFVKDNEFLANFELQDVDPTYKKGELKIKVSFEIDSNGMISAMAEDMTNASSHVVSRKVTVTKMYSNDDKKIQDILETAECEKMSDVKRANMVLAKLELYDSFKYLLSVFQDRRDDILGSDDKNFKQIKLNEIFNDVFNTIQNYEKYTPDELKAAKMAFEDSWHEIVFGFTFLVSDDGSVVKGGSSTI